MTYGGNGPRAGRTTGRSRDTLVNNASKGTMTTQSYQAPVSSASAVQYGDQLANARYSYLQQLAALKAQRTQVGQQYGIAVADAKSAAVGNMVSAEGSALDRGVLGGSNDMANRAAVIAERTRAFQDAESQRATARLQLGQQALTARGDYYTTLGSIQNAMAQEQYANTIAAFQNDQFNALQQNYGAILRMLRQQKRGDVPTERTGASVPYGTPTYGSNGMQDGVLTPAEIRAIEARKNGRR